MTTKSLPPVCPLDEMVVQRRVPFHIDGHGSEFGFRKRDGRDDVAFGDLDALRQVVQPQHQANVTLAASGGDKARQRDRVFAPCLQQFGDQGIGFDGHPRVLFFGHGQSPVCERDAPLGSVGEADRKPPQNDALKRGCQEEKKMKNRSSKPFHSTRTSLRRAFVKCSRDKARGRFVRGQKRVL